MKKISKILNYVISLTIIAFFAVGCSSPGDRVTLYDGTSEIKTIDVKVNSEYDFGTMDKIGYTFLGWYSDSNGGSAYTDASGKSAGMTWKETNQKSVYAHWKANTYNVKFEYNDATSQNTVKNVSLVYDESINVKFPVPLKTGYSFAGWYTDQINGFQITDGSGNFVENTDVYNTSKYPINSDGTTLYARWGKKAVVFNFVSDGSAVQTVTYHVGDVINSLPVSIKDNYCFEAWYFDSTLLHQLTYPYTISESLEENVTLYAKYKEGSNNVLQFSSIASTGDREYEVSYSGNDKEIIIPDSYYGKKVTRIRKINSETVEKVLLPQTITDFINGAFENCISLKEINIPNGIKTLPEKLFAGSVNLIDLNIPNSIETIGKLAFSGCSNIDTISIPSSVKTIGPGAFRNMDSLESFEVANDNERYMSIDGVLYYKVGSSSYLVQYPAAKEGDTYSIDSSAVKIMEYAFSCSKLKTLIIEGKVSSIETGAFENSANLVNLTIRSSTLSFSIGEKAFENCYNFRMLKMELEKVPTLSENAFHNVSDTFSIYVSSNMLRNYQTSANWRNLSNSIYSLSMIFGDYALEEYNDGYAVRQYFGTGNEVIIPEIINTKRIIKISDNAFSFTDIEKVTISKNITEIGEKAFYECTNLLSITMEGLPPVLGNDVFSNIADDFGIYIKNTTEVLEQYRATSKWCDMSEHIWSYQSINK